jgi:isopenicillin-N N-acyltransferase like protein
MSDKGNKRTLKIVDVNGSHYEMGFQYGKACPEISGMLDMTCQLYGGQDKVNSILDKYILMYLPHMEEYAPEIVEQLKGMAAGANVDFRDILFLNITYEISVPSVMGGCTSFAASGEATADGKLITGQNLDHIEPWKDYMILLKMKPAEGPSMMAVTAAGCLGLIGINSAGISINLNLLRTKDSLAPTGGVPTHVIVNKLFMSESLDKAITAIASAEGRSAKNYLVANGQEGIINIETTANDMEIQFPERGILTHANSFKTDRFKSSDVAPLVVPDSYIRFPILYRRMEQHYEHITVDVMKQLLQDHVNYPNSICRHPDQKALLPYSRIMKTLISIISCPEEQQAYIATGNPCENEYSEYLL